MKLTLNNSPDLSMAEITRKLFNSKFLSDIIIIVGDQQIYAHSLELMKRSTVFENLLTITLGEPKLILIEKFSYASVYQFFRFIYTDQCDVDCEIVFDLIKLAMKYKIAKLENLIVEFLNSDPKYTLQLFDMCITLKWQLPLGRVIENLAYDLPTYLMDEHFLKIQPKALEQILNFNRTNIDESQMLCALIKWIQHDVEKHPIPINEAEVKYGKYLQLIRFRSMSVVNVRNELFKNNDWTGNHEISLMFKTASEKYLLARHNEMYKSRLEFGYPYDWVPNSENHISSTLFTITQDLLLIGLRYGNDAPETNHKIQLSCRDLIQNTTSSIRFRNPVVHNGNGSRNFSFGDCLRLQPNMEYKIDILYSKNMTNSSVFFRKENRNIIVRAPRNAILLSRAGPNMIEMHFKAVFDEEDLIILE